MLVACQLNTANRRRHARTYVGYSLRNRDRDAKNVKGVCSCCCGGTNTVAEFEVVTEKDKVGEVYEKIKFQWETRKLEALGQIRI